MNNCHELLFIVFIEGKVFSNANDTNINKPLYTVSSTFVPPKSVQPAIKYEMNSTQSLPGPGPSTATTTSKDSNGKLSLMSNDEIDTIVNHIIGVQMDGIEKEIQHCKHLSNNLMNNVGIIAVLVAIRPQMKLLRLIFVAWTTRRDERLHDQFT